MPKPGGTPGGGGGGGGKGGKGGVAFDILGLTDLSDTGISASDDLTALDTGFTITGTIDPSIASFTIWINGVDYQVNTIDSAGNWSFTYAGPPLDDGTVLVEASYTTVHPKNGKTQTVSAEPYSFTLDSTDPAPPPAPTLVDDGSLDTPDFSGSAEAGSTVVIYVDGSRVGETTAAADGSWTFDWETQADSGVGPLSDGDHTATATATDAAGNSSAVSGALAFTVGNANNPATISGTTNGEVTEDGTLSTGASLTVSDPDPGEAALQPLTAQGENGYGTFTVQTDGTWTYALDNADPAVQALGAGDTLTDSITVFSADGSASTTLTVTITGSNDVPTITGTTSGSVAEDGTATATGSLVASDADAGESGFIAQSGVAGIYGSFSVTVSGSWSYSLNNAGAAVQSLRAGETVTDSFTVTSADGSASETVVITVTGANDTATISGTVSGSVSEDGTLSAAGAVTVFDPDAGESAAAAVTAGTPSANGYGSYEVLTDGSWVYTLDNSHPDVQALGTGQTLTDSFTITSADGSASQVVTITINGADEAPPPPPPPGGDSYAPDDPLYSQQWHLTMLGDIEAIWADFTGAGVSVGVYDNGIEYVHPDLAANYDASKHVWVNGVQLDPAPSQTVTAEHGTAVAGVIAAVDNSEGGVGVAFGASLTGINIFGGPADINGANISGYQQAIDQAWTFDIINNSWGAAPDFNNESAPSTLASLSGFQTAVETGRGGLGTIIVKAAGNEHDNANGDALNALRYTITVAAHDQDGDASWYTNRGPNVLVSAPSSGSSADADSGILTTDEQGGEGYGPGDYTPDFGGTSSATPVVSGVVALMLDANPDLGWRDVQTILAYSAHFLGGNPDGTAPVPADSDGDGVADTTVEFPIEFFDWFYNGAGNWNGGGLHFSEDYGYGGVDAYNAVRMAEVWSLFGAPQTSANEVIVEGALQTPGLVYDNSWVGASYTYTQAMADANPMELEYVEVYVDFNSGHGSLFGDLSDVSLELVSPSGTVVSLIQSANAMSGADAWQSTNSWLPALGGTMTWTFGITALRGEDLVGDWTVRIIDVDDDPFGGTDGGVLNAFSLTFYGAAADADDVYHYTSEILDLGLYADAGRRMLDDSGGNDWLDMAAMPQDLEVDLASDGTGGASVAGGATFVEIAAGTLIENAVTGDGNDTIVGNDAANQLAGRRGDDQLWGGLGDDVFIFYAGDGNDWIWDFEDGFGSDDIIALYGFGFDSTADFLILDAGVNTVLDFGNGDTITLAGFADPSLIGDDDFVFV